ncbi:MAG TPA: hypothetical protein VD903_18860 [Pseudonocardia sp.]|nr:hypothetical protein [Pseudonocardia sp.]
MPMIAMALPIPPEKYPVWRETVLSFAGARRAEYDASRRRMGVVRQGVWVQQTPQGPVEILVIDAADPATLFERLATSQEPFDVEFRAFVLDVYGLDLAEPLPSPLPEQLLDWSAAGTGAPA